MQSTNIIANSARDGISSACSMCGTNLPISVYSVVPEPEVVPAHFAEAAVEPEKVNSIDSQCALRTTQ